MDSKVVDTNLLDANIFITAKNGPYDFGLVPSFWKFLDNEIIKQTIFTSPLVYDEITNGRDDRLAEWIKDHKDCGFVVEHDRPVQEKFAEIAVYVRSTYQPAYAEPFLSGADPWLIAHAS